MLLNKQLPHILDNLDEVPPGYVMETLSFSPKNDVLERFNPCGVLAEVDAFLSYCKESKIPEEVISDINITTIMYIKKCKKQKSPRHIQATKHYLRRRVC